MYNFELLQNTLMPIISFYSRSEVEQIETKPKPKNIQRPLNILASFHNTVTTRKWRAITTTLMTIISGTKPG